jgi:hypothetical protein
VGQIIFHEHTERVGKTESAEKYGSSTTRDHPSPETAVRSSSIGVCDFLGVIGEGVKRCGLTPERW